MFTLPKHKEAPLFKTALLYLVLTAALGTFLRYIYVSPPAWAMYKYWLHAHSHIAFLGWVYNALFALILFYFIPKENQKRLIRLFWITQLATLGMLVFFPIQGYARESIIFSTLHIFFSWAFAYWVWRRMKAANRLVENYLKWALAFMVLSSLGPFALGPLMVNGLAGSNWYYLAIYFYLHFQYNAWFILALLALLYQHKSTQGRVDDEKSGRRALICFVSSSILAYSLSALWAYPYAWLYALAGLSGILQLAACWYLYRSLKSSLSSLFRQSQPLLQALVVCALLAFLLKSLMQLAGAIPAFSDLAFFQRNTIIAFLHLIFLGVVTPALLALGMQQQWLASQSRQSALGVSLFLLAFVLHEVVLLALPYLPQIQVYYPQLILGISATLLLAFSILVSQLWRKKTTVQSTRNREHPTAFRKA